MAEGGDFGIEDPYLDHAIDHDDDDDESTPLLRNETGSFTTSTPAYQTRVREEMEMKTFQEKSGHPGTSYTETSFGGTKDIERRLGVLKRDSITGMIKTTEIPDVYSLSPEQEEQEIQRVQDFIKRRYPNADFSKQPITFSSKKPMDIVIKGVGGGETKILKNDGTDFQASFLKLKFVQKAIGESYEELSQKEEQTINEERKMLAEVIRKSPEKKVLIDSLKDKISKKETEKKKEKERKFYETKQTEEIKEREEEIKKQDEKDQKVLNDENAFPEDKEAAEERIAERNEELAGLQTLVQERERAMSLRERFKNFLKKYVGVILTSFFIAAGATVSAVLGEIINGLKKIVKDLRNGLKALGAKAASALPGLIGAVAKFLFNVAGSAISFLAEHTWLLILAVVAFLFQKLMEKN